MFLIAFQNLHIFNLKSTLFRFRSIKKKQQWKLFLYLHRCHNFCFLLKIFVLFSDFLLPIL